MGNRLRSAAIVGVVQAAAFVMWPACASAPVRQSEVPVTWAPGSYPVELRMSLALDECQRASVLAAAAWWESRAAIDLFTPRDVAADDPAVHGIPAERVIAVGPVDSLSRPTIVGQAWPWLRGGKLATVDVDVIGCSPRIVAHELGHSIGLPHSYAAGALMAPVHETDSWGVSVDELRLVRMGGTGGLMLFVHP